MIVVQVHLPKQSACLKRSTIVQVVCLVTRLGLIVVHATKLKSINGMSTFRSSLTHLDYALAMYDPYTPPPHLLTQEELQAFAPPTKRRKGLKV